MRAGRTPSVYIETTDLSLAQKMSKQVEAIRKEMCKIFKQNSLQITIEANKKVLDFLYITLDLRTVSYKPYNKPNSNFKFLRTYQKASTYAYLPILKMFRYSMKHAPHTQKP